MALTKTINLPSGITGNYHRVSSFRWDRNAKEASITFSLHLNSAAAELDRAPLLPLVAKFRITGDKFEEFLGNSVLTASQDDIITAIYKAAVLVCSAKRANPNAPTVGAHLISDFGADLYADAVRS